MLDQIDAGSRIGSDPVRSVPEGSHPNVGRWHVTRIGCPSANELHSRVHIKPPVRSVVSCDPAALVTEPTPSTSEDVGTQFFDFFQGQDAGVDHSDFPAALGQAVRIFVRNFEASNGRPSAPRQKESNRPCSRRCFIMVRHLRYAPRMDAHLSHMAKGSVRGPLNSRVGTIKERIFACTPVRLSRDILYIIK